MTLRRPNRFPSGSVSGPFHCAGGARLACSLQPIVLALGTISRALARSTETMITIDDALANVAQAESSSQLSTAAAVAIRRWLTETPFVHYWPRLLQDIAAGRWKVL